MREEWVEIVPGYDVSNRGRVRSWKKRGRYGGLSDEPAFLSAGTDKCGYQYVILGDENGSHFAYIHTLVLKAFVGLRPKGQECRHLDGIPDHNDVRNLCWGTHKENEQDKVRHGGTRCISGESHWRAVRLSSTVVVRIQRRFAKGDSVSSIAKHVGLSWHITNGIVKGRHWSVREV